MIFRGDKHSYERHNTKYTSVTTLIGKYKQPFNQKYWTKYKSYQKLLGEGKFKQMKNAYHSDWRSFDYNDFNFFKYLDKVSPVDKGILKVEVEALKAHYQNESIIGAKKGTEYHDFKEAQAIEDKFTYHPITNKKIETKSSIIKTIKNNKKIVTSITEDLFTLEDGYYPEMLLWNDEYMISGQADRVFIETIDGTRYVTVDDYKSNKKISTSGMNKMANPLGHLYDCVSGETKLITKKGIIKIKDAVDKPIDIWNGEVWSPVIPFKTKSNTVLYRVSFDDGSYLDVTDTHKFLIKYRLDKGFVEQTTLDIINKLNTTKWLPRVPNSNIKYEEGGIEVLEAYDYGFLLGDGTMGKYKSTITAGLYNDDKKIQFITGQKRVYQNNTFQYFNLDYKFSKALKYDSGLPDVIFSWDKKSILNFISGWIDADGTNQHGKIRLYGKEDKIRDAQLLLTKCGIKSSVKIAGFKGDKTSLSSRQSDLYYLSISKTIELNTQRVLANSTSESTKKHKWQIIQSIEKLEDLQDSYCLTEELNNQCVFNNVLTKQCNYNHYRIQISMYAWLLTQFGFEIKDVMFTHLNKPYNFEYMETEVESILMDIKGIVYSTDW